MTKVEMEAHHAEYHALVDRARLARQDGRYREAIELASASWDHLDGALQYERKHGSQEPVHPEGIAIVLDCAPYLFDFQSLDALESLLKAQRRIFKNGAVALADGLAAARSLMLAAHRLWEQLEVQAEWDRDQSPSAFAHADGQNTRILSRWYGLGIVDRVCDGNPPQYALATRMGQLVRGKCPSCGAVVKAVKLKLLERAACPKCRESVVFVLIPGKPRTAK